MSPSRTPPARPKPPPEAHSVYRQFITENRVRGKRLGRVIHVDSRSAGYPYQKREEAPLAASLLKRNIPILDQGQVGSCEGNAETGACGTDPLFATMPGGVTLNETEALSIYSAAETLDGDGPYPPNDNGTSNTSAMKAARNMGLIAGFTHCATVADMADALQTWPLTIGINWYDSFDSPASDGTIAISANAVVRGGHALELRGVDPGTQMFRGDNSWGTSWGDKGSFQISWDTMTRLLSEQGEATVPVPLNQPAPVPIPVPPPAPPSPPGPDPELAAYLTDQRLIRWSHARHWQPDNKYAAGKYAALRASAGL